MCGWGGGGETTPHTDPALISPMRTAPEAHKPPQQIISCWKLLIFKVSLEAERTGGLIWDIFGGFRILQLFFRERYCQAVTVCNLNVTHSGKLDYRYFSGFFLASELHIFGFFRFRVFKGKRTDFNLFSLRFLIVYRKNFLGFH